MNALDQRSSSLSEAATRNAERRMMLESELRARKDRLAALKKNNYQSAAGGDRISDLDKQIGDYESAISAMKIAIPTTIPICRRPATAWWC